MSRLKRRSDQRAEAVLEATSSELAENGYAALTVDRVALRAQASKATIYRNWPTKIDLVLAVAESIQPVVMPPISPSENLRGALTAALDSLQELTDSRPGRLLLALHEASRAEPRINDAVDRLLVAPLHESLAHFVHDLQRHHLANAQVDAWHAGRLIASVVVDRALASGTPTDSADVHVFRDQWLIPVLGPKVRQNRTPGPTAGPG